MPACQAGKLATHRCHASKVVYAQRNIAARLQPSPALPAESRPAGPADPLRPAVGTGL